ncbi:hypothetical protein P1P68_02295 [Streptomyces scabiei]|uniref:hypothetical protein n=1 Tax=Streptomyces scabiei TaxID=1930 RepID=UPI00298FE236|nr:hypothetical protein [Streptomyces scabiei]MDW8803665.1 hypothetical protein [Streptomyces scabiei]
MSGTNQPQRTLPPLLILASPAGITTIWVMPEHHGWPMRDSAIAAAVVFLAVLSLPYLPRLVAGTAKATVTKRKSKKQAKKDDSKKDDGK